MAHNDSQETMDQLLEWIGGNDDTNFRINASGVLQLKNVTSDTYHTVWLASPDGVAELQIAEEGEF